MLNRLSPRRAAVAAAALVVSLVAPSLSATARADEATFKVTAVVRDLAGGEIEPEDSFLTDGDGRQYSHDWDENRGSGLYVPPGRYTFHFRAVTKGYSAGFQSGDKGAPGLFIEAPVEITGDTALDWTVPLVDFPVHVVDRAGNPGSDLWLEGESRRSFEVAPGVVASGVLLNANKARTDGAGNGALVTFEHAAPASVAATNIYDVLGRVSPAPSDTSAVLVLNNPVLEGQLLDRRGPLPAPAADNAWVSFSSGPGAGKFWPSWPYGGTSFSLQGEPGDRELFVSNRGVFDDDDPPHRPASATLPGTWMFVAPYHHGRDATVDLTIPDAAPANILVLGPDGQPVSGVTMEYEAVARDSVELAPGIAARATASDLIGEVAGHFRPMLFGPSSLTFTLDDGRAVTGPLTISPGDHVTIRVDGQDGTPSPPQNVTAAAGDGRVKVTWDPPADDGGSPITAYTVTASRNASNTKATFGPDATSGTIRSLTNGKAYTVTVVAKNANGVGRASSPLTVTLGPDEPPTTTTTVSPGVGNGGGGAGDDHGTGGGPVGGAGTGGGGDKTGTVPSGSGRSGYWLLGADGAVYPFGDAAPHGDASAAISATNSGSGGGAPAGLAVRAVDIEPTPSGRGYWVLDSSGRVRPFGDASSLGDVIPGRLPAGEAPASLSSTPSGAGYWVFTNRGRTLPFGDAAFLGDVSGTPLNGPVLDSVATPTGRGYYMVASDGGIFAFGDARFAGSMGGRRLNAPVRSLVPDGDGAGYWLVGSDGGVFAFGAPFRGSLGGVRLNKPVRGMVRYGDGYVMVGEDGGIFAFSDKPFSGSLGGRPPAGAIISVAALG